MSKLYIKYTFDREGARVIGACLMYMAKRFKGTKDGEDIQSATEHWVEACALSDNDTGTKVMSKLYIPDNAIRVTYDYSGISGLFYVWQTAEGKWQWENNGANGEEITQNLAVTAARTWAQTQSTVS